MRFILVEITIPLRFRFSHLLHNFATDADIAGEGALLVDVGAILSLEWGLEAETNVPEVANASLGFFAPNTPEEIASGILFLERSFILPFN